MDKVFIKDLVARGIIGVNEWEREGPQEMLINITAFTDTRRAAQTDDLADCVDYSALAQKVQAHAETAARFTVEAPYEFKDKNVIPGRIYYYVLEDVDNNGAANRSKDIVEVKAERGGQSLILASVVLAAISLFVLIRGWSLQRTLTSSKSEVN